MDALRTKQRPRLLLAVVAVAAVLGTALVSASLVFTRSSGDGSNPDVAQNKFVGGSVAGRQQETARTGVITRSHFSKVHTSLKDLPTLKKSLDGMGLKVLVQETVGTEQPLTVRGYQGDVQEAQLVIQQENGKDIGFRFNGESYELVTDLQFWQQPTPPDVFLEKLTQKYAVNVVIEATAEAGFDLVEQSVDELGAVNLQVSRYAVHQTVMKFVPHAAPQLARPQRQRISAPSVSMSHFSNVQTSLKDLHILKKSLDGMGLNVLVGQVAGVLQPLVVRGYKGDVQEAQLVIQQENGKDLGFRFNGESYELVTDLQYWQQATPPDVFLEKLTQRYAIETIKESTVAAGFEMVQEPVLEKDGSIKIEVSRYAMN